MIDSTGGVPDDKIAAYCATDYRVVTGDNHQLVLRIGHTEPALMALLTNAKLQTGAFITAYNPLGAQVDEATNKSAQLRLSQRLAEISEVVHPGEGADPTGAWPPEPSLFAIGITGDEACAIGMEFMQDAIVWVDHNCMPELLLLR